MKVVFLRRSWLATGIAAVALSVGLSFALRQDKVEGQDRSAASTASVDHAKASDSTAAAKTPEELKHDPVVEHANSLSRAFRESAHVAMPSVVTVYSHEAAKKVKSQRGEHGMGGMQFGEGEDPFKGTPF